MDIVTILGLAPLASGPLKRYLRGSDAKRLDRLIGTELGNDPALADGLAERLINEWFYVHHDPRGAVIVAALLLHGDVKFIDAFKVRARELLEGVETLPRNVDWMVDRLSIALRDNFVAAQKDEATQTQRGTSAVLSAMERLADRIDSQDLRDVRERITPPPPRPIFFASSFDETQRHRLDQLSRDSAEAAGRLSELLSAGGVNSLSQAARVPPAWSADLPAVFWRGAARILVDAGRLADGERAYVVEAERPDGTDLAGALAGAARCAIADSRPDDATRHIIDARRADPEHPMVLLYDVERLDDASQRLAATDAVEPRDALQSAAKSSIRALALISLRRFDEARAAARASIEADPFGRGRELETLALIIRAHHRLPTRDRDDRPVADAVQYQLSLLAESREAGRPGMAGVAGARAALGTAVLGDRRAAGDLIDMVTGNPALMTDDEARSTLFQAALVAADVARARSLLEPSDTSPEGRLRVATIDVLDDAGDPCDAATRLDELIPQLQPGELRNEAILMRLVAAGDPAVDLDPSLAAELDDGERLLAHMRAQRALVGGDFASARALLATFDDAGSLGLRVSIAVTEGKMSEAIGLQAAVARKAPTAANLLALARLRAQTGDFAGATRDAFKVAIDDRRLTSVRDEAYQLASRAALDAGDFAELEDMTDRWAELSPERTDPLWMHAFAIAQLDRHADALEFVRSSGLEADADVDQALFLSELYMHGIDDGAARIRALMELSDRFDRPQRLEQAFIGGVLKTAPSERGEDDPEVVARFQKALSTFQERFPDSGAITAVHVDDDDDDQTLIAKLASVAPPPDAEAADARMDAINGVRQARTPIAQLAVMVGKGTVETIIRNGAHPLAELDGEARTAELAAAERALNVAAASWDETACVTVAQLPEADRQRIIGMLPASVIGQTVRTSLGNEARAQMGGEQVAVMHILPDGTPRIVEENPDTVTRVRAVQSAADHVAAALTTEPDKSRADDELSPIVNRGDGPFSAMASAMLIARAGDLPLYCDDRVTRAFARGLGIPAFGTVALVHASMNRGAITEQQANDWLAALMGLGVWSIDLAPELYVDVARGWGFSLDRATQPLLADEAVLRGNRRVAHNAQLLKAIVDEAPALLHDWAGAILRSYEEILEAAPIVVASLITARLLDPELIEVSPDAVANNAAIVEALRRSTGGSLAEPDSDPLVGGISRWLTALDVDLRDAALSKLLTQVPDDQRELIRDFFSSPPGGQEPPA